MNYDQLTIHQRISLKGLFASDKERRDIGVKNHEYFNAICGIMLLWNFKKAVEFYLNEDINALTD